jgi:hypothetical protein
MASTEGTPAMKLTTKPTTTRPSTNMMTSKIREDEEVS